MKVVIIKEETKAVSIAKYTETVALLGEPLKSEFGWNIADIIGIEVFKLTTLSFIYNYFGIEFPLTIKLYYND